jgi:L-threonylcarbamoyladenylate synthase
VAGHELAAALAALRAGEPVLLPTDGVYGLCASLEGAAPLSRVYALKGRDARRPAALLASSVEVLLEQLPELRGRAELIARTLLPGPYTLVFPNPARRYGWLNGERGETIGVRVARLPPATSQLLATVGVLAATSANLSGEPAAARLDQVPDSIRAGCGAELDAGTLPGTASSVLDFSADPPRIIRRGAGDVEAALAAVEAALAAARAG